VQVRRLIDHLVAEVLEPAHEYLDQTEREAEASIEKNHAFADRLVYGLLLLAACGAAGGLLAGFGFARGLSRSLIQLSVLIRDTAGRLNDGVEAVTLSGPDLRELESVLRLLGERVGEIVERLQQQEREVLRAEQLAAVGQLAAGMAHELRNPLTSMKLLVQGATTGADGWSGRWLSGRDLSVLEEEINRLDRLIQSFLDFARPPRPEKRTIDVGTLVEQTLAFVAGRAAAALVRVEFLQPPAPTCAAVDPGQFRQVLLNLILNALDATPAGGTVTVGLEAGFDGGVKLEVADSGCGLPAALGERIFDPFTTTKETGLGLGLSICKRIAVAHGGSLTGADRPGGGAVFTLLLGRTRDEG
jgi:signal transduction histidine kinase